MDVQSPYGNLKAIREVEMKIKQTEIVRYQYISIVSIDMHFHDKEKLFPILSNLHANLFRIDFSKMAVAVVNIVAVHRSNVQSILVVTSVECFH